MSIRSEVPQQNVIEATDVNGEKLERAQMPPKTTKSIKYDRLRDIVHDTWQW